MFNTISNNIEAWMLIDGYDNYEVSSFGRVRNNRSSRILKSLFHCDGYARINLYKNSQRKTHTIHRLVAETFCANPEGKKQVDHIDNHPENNHYSNLRWTTSSENLRNRQLTSRNTSGYRGIWTDNKTGKWVAEYRLNNKKKHLGSFHSKEEAGRAYDKAILEVDPEHAVLNFPIPQNQRNVYISYHTLKKHLADIKKIIDGFNKINS